jgi:2-methylisocitrate lyase-like PEP mutase family enzyme
LANVGAKLNLSTGAKMSALTSRFRLLHADVTPLLLPNAWDAVSARLFESLGAKAIATTSAGMAWSLGYTDGRSLPFDEVVDAVRRMIRVVTVPVSVDIENGYSDEPAVVADNVMRLVELGVAGINIEDGQDDSALLAKKISAIKGAVSKAGKDLFVNARSDVYLANLAEPGKRAAESIARGKRYAEAGADGLFLPLLIEATEIQEVAKSIGLPLNVMARPELPPARALGQLGVRRLSTGSGVDENLLGHAAKLVGTFLEDGNSASLSAGAMPYPNVQALFAHP